LITFIPRTLYFHTRFDQRRQLNSTIYNLTNKTFIRLILSSPVNKSGDLNKATIRLIELKGEPKLSFLFSHKTKDITKNFGIDEGVAQIEEMFESVFTMCVFFTTLNDFSFRRTKKGKILYKRAQPAHSEVIFLPNII
jgi:hypothetical protein